MTMINNFLAKCTQRVLSSSSKLTIVLSNEGGDMDSVIGAIYLAMFLDKCEKFNVKNVIPVINFPHKDLRLRNDVFMLLQKFDVNKDLIISVCEEQKEEVESSQDVSLENAKNDCEHFICLDCIKHQPLIVLYDQNVLPKRFDMLKENVVAIVDHHVDEGLYKESCENITNLRIVETAASACTLVAQLYKDNHVKIECPSLLIAPIVLDSVNFNPEQKKVTPLDIAMYEWLREEEREAAKLNFSSDTVILTEATVLFNELKKWRNDIFSLSFNENLRRDYKQFSFEQINNASNLSDNVEIGISSMPCSFIDLCNNYSDKVMCESCFEYLEKNRLHGLLIALAGKRGKEHTREVVMFSAPPTLQRLIRYTQVEPGGVKFTETKSIMCKDDYQFVCYTLSDTSVSRKRLTPSLAQYFKQGTVSSLEKIKH